MRERERERETKRERKRERVGRRVRGGGHCFNMSHTHTINMYVHAIFSFRLYLQAMIRLFMRRSYVLRIF